MERAGTRQRLASETAEEREVRLHHGGELVYGRPRNPVNPLKQHIGFAEATSLLRGTR